MFDRVDFMLLANNLRQKSSFQAIVLHGRKEQKREKYMFRILMQA